MTAVAVGPVISSPVEAVEELNHYITQWCLNNTIDESVPRRSCAELAQSIARNALVPLKEITKDFDNKLKYPERPMIQLSGAKPGEPTVWLLGWRAGEATPIHDHGNSQAGVHVLEGAVTEEIYVPHVALKNIGDESRFRTVTRELLEGSTVRITSPYIHLFHKTCEGYECIHATTIHCYWPRLLLMNYLQVQDESDPHAEPHVKFVDVWEDKG